MSAVHKMGNALQPDRAGVTSAERYLGILLLLYCTAQLLALAFFIEHASRNSFLWALLEGGSGAFLLLRSIPKPRLFIGGFMLIGVFIFPPVLQSYLQGPTLAAVLRTVEMLALAALATSLRVRAEGRVIPRALPVTTTAVVLLASISFSLIPVVRSLQKLTTPEGSLQIVIEQFETDPADEVHVSPRFGDLSLPEGWKRLKTASQDWENTILGQIAPLKGQGRPLAVLGHREPPSIALLWATTHSKPESDQPDLESFDPASVTGTLSIAHCSDASCAPRIFGRQTGSSPMRHT